MYTYAYIYIYTCIYIPFLNINRNDKSCSE